MASSRKNPRVLFVTPEVFPLCKTGGLGDISAALPLALQELKVDVRLLLPGYSTVLSALKYKRKLVEIDLSPHFPPATLFASRVEVHESGSVPVYVIGCPALYQRAGGPYLDDNGHDWPDNALRFGLLSKIGALLGSDASPLSWIPDVIHCNDWQSGLTPAYLHFHSGKKAASLMTLHNLAFQGCFPPDQVTKLGLPAESFNVHGLEYYGSMSFLKGGIYYASKISTVSPGYAREIQTEPLGFGLQGLLADRSSDITGILNGIDTTVWNPATDPHITKKYTSRNLTAKTVNKLALQQAAGLETNGTIPLFASVSRISHQKGHDLILQVAPMLVDLPAQLVLLGSGSTALEEQLITLAQTFPAQIAVRIDYDEVLSHLILAGADCFLMPSRFEPCGLNQMYSQHYGTPPVVHATGGLIDTVTDLTPRTLANERASGFHFHEMTVESFLDAIKRAADAYHSRRMWRSLQRNGMRKDFSWNASARAYRSIYSSLIQR